jgi:hypothetical protein
MFTPKTSTITTTQSMRVAVTVIAIITVITG